MAKFFVNGEQVDFRAAPDTPLLWALRDQLGLTGTKFGCGMAQCGACTVHLDGIATRSCVLPVSAVVGKKITTIEQVGAPTEVYRRPATKFVATFIGSPAMNLIKGRVAAPGRVEIANGGALEYEAKAFEAAAGREVEVGVRPEDVVLAHGANGAGVALQSEFAEELGPNRLLHGSVGGAPFVVSVPSSDEAPPLGNLRLSAPVDKIHLFDLERGQSLRCAS